jgi:hypothetical protein
MKTPDKIEQILYKEPFQVLLFSCKSNIPFGFFRHPWFVINKNGELSRWEVLIEKNRCTTSWNHLHNDLFPPLSGIGYLPWFYKFLKKGRFEGHVSGDENSIAKKVADFIENSPNTYQYRDRYLLSGPNSNTYAQWILDNFPEFKVKLPKRSVGKNYKTKQK